MMIERIISWLEEKFTPKPTIAYLSGIRKSSNYDGGEIGSTDGNRKE